MSTSFWSAAILNDDLDLGGEDALALASRLDLALERMDAAVDDLLPLARVLTGCGRDDDEHEARKKQADAEA